MGSLKPLETLKKCSLQFQVEELKDVFNEMKPYFKAHYDELATFKDKIPKVDVDGLFYARLESAGCLHVVTARDEARLVGYYVGAVLPQPHYKNIICASADLYYLAPEYRKAQNGVMFLLFIQDSLKERGVQWVIMGTKMNKDLGELYRALGYEKTDEVWRKWLA